MNTWRSLKYSTYHRIQSFHSAFVQTLISGLPCAVTFQEAHGKGRLCQISPP
jgi:hypothetical protein